MLPRLWRLVAAVVLLAGASLAVAQPSAQAAEPQCDTIVIDATASHVLGDTSGIEAAATNLGNLGADVRVRAFESVDDPAVGGSLDAYRDNMVQQCASWRGSDGKLKSNMMLYLMSMDRKSAIFYGGNWRDELDDSVDYIRGTVMGDQFRNGDFAAGFVQAMDATYQTINEQQNPAPQPPSESFGNTTFGVVFVWLLVGVAIIALIIFGAIAASMVFRKRRERKRRLADAKAEAVEVRNDATDELGALSMRDTVDTDVELIKSDLNQEDADELDSLYKQYTSKLNGAYALNSRLLDKGSRFDPDKPQSIEQYAIITNEYSQLRDEAQAATSLADELDTKIAELRQEMKDAPTRVGTLRQLLASTADLHQQDQAAGNKPLDSAKLEQAEALIAKAEANIADKRFGQAIGKLEEAEELINEDAEALQTLQRLRTQAKADLRRLQDAEHHAQQGLDAAPAIIEQLRNKFAPACANDVAATIDPLTKQLREAAAQVRRAEQCASADKQDWHEAKQAIDEADALFEPVLAGISDITASDEELSALQAGVGSRIDAKLSNISAVKQSIATFKGDHSTALNKLDKIERDLTELANAANAELPDPRVLDRELAAASRKVNSIYKEAEETDAKIRAREAAEQREREERAARERRRRSNSDSFGSSFAGGYMGSSLGSHHSSDGGSSFGGGSSGGWGGGDSGGSSGGW